MRSIYDLENEASNCQFYMNHFTTNTFFFTILLVFITYISKSKYDDSYLYTSIYIYIYIYTFFH